MDLQEKIFENKAVATRAGRRFSTVLMATIIALATLSVILVLGVLNRHFNRRVELEFENSLNAQKGQVEILIQNRIANIRKALEEFSDDNTIRVTVMLGVDKQLTERITQDYPVLNGVYFFVQKRGNPGISPLRYDDLPAEIIENALKTYPWGDFVYDGNQLRLLWLFFSPVMHTDRRMGTAYALYDMSKDRALFASIQRAVDGGVALLGSDALISLDSGQTLTAEIGAFENTADKAGFISLKDDSGFSQITNAAPLYYHFSLRSLNDGKKKVAILMGAVSVLVLMVSTLISIFIGRKMAQPLKEMTRKAIQISEGQKELRFDVNGSYWEFDQLSQAFNYMLNVLKSAEERSRYKELLEKVDDAVYIVDQKGKILDANVAAYSRLGYRPVAFFTLDLHDLIPHSDADKIMSLLADDHHRALPKRIIETLHRCNDGTNVPVEIYSRPIQYQGRDVILNVARDISERIEMEKALRESEERYRSVVENANDGIMILDEQLRILYANKSASEILGYSIESLVGSDLESYFSRETPVFPETFTPRAEAQGEDPNPIVYQVRRGNDEKRTVRISTNRFTDSKNVEKLVVQFVDVTDQLRMEEEKKQLETQFFQAQKLEAIGTLAGGVAHDFNNMLMGIQGRLSMIRLKSTADQPHYTDIDQIEKTVMSASNLTKQLLGFARKGSYEIRPTGIDTLVRESTSMFISTRKEIDLKLDCEEDVWAAQVDRGQMEQVLINLYVNAWQAMPKGGQLTIRAGNIHLSEEFCRPHEVPAGKYVKITVSDTGLGMDPETMSRIFEPFFTTKGVGKGTGLGLASAYGIIKNHKGIIQVESRENHGTTFSIFLPASDSVPAPKIEDSNRIVRGKGTILIVDDEEESIVAEEAMLRELGYHVLHAGSGEEAIRICRDNPNRLDLITLDMIMPGMSGLETFERLRDLNPAIKVLLISGYSRNDQAEQLIRMGCVGFLQKPFNLESLSRKINEALGQQRQGQTT